MDCFVALLLAMTSPSDHDLPHHAAAIHLVFEIDHRRTREVPSEAATRGPAADQLVGKNGMKIADRIGLHAGRVLPAEAEFREPLFHRMCGEADLFLDPVRGEIAVSHDPLPVSPGPFARFRAAGNDKGWRRAFERSRV